MHPSTMLLSGLSLLISGAVVSATTIKLIPAIPNGQPAGGTAFLSKRGDVECNGGDFYCPEGYKCMTGSNGVPGCCPKGETCDGPGEIQTIVATNTVRIDYTSFSTYIYTTTGTYTGGPEPTEEPTEKEEESKTTDAPESEKTNTKDEEEEEQQEEEGDKQDSEENEDTQNENDDQEGDDYGSGFTDMYPTSTLSTSTIQGHANATGKHNTTIHTGVAESIGAAGRVTVGGMMSGHGVFVGVVMGMVVGWIVVV